MLNPKTDRYVIKGGQKTMTIFDTKTTEAVTITISGRGARSNPRRRLIERILRAANRDEPGSGHAMMGE